MRTSTRVRRCVVAGGWAVVAVAAGCASGAAARRPTAGGRPVAGRARHGGAEVDDSIQVGYGTQGRRRMTGSVGSVSGDETRTQHMTRIDELLQRIPGVVVSPRGDGTFSVLVRGGTPSLYGRSDPLVVMDGLPVTDGIGALNAIAPQDVERIDVLKDADASIYGARSANGVILIRTRHTKAVRD